MSRPPPLPEPDTASLAYSGHSVDYINGYERGYESAADQLRERDRQIVEMCAIVCERRMQDSGVSLGDRTYYTDAIRSLLEEPK